MKFAHDFKETLAKQDFPDLWIKQAIPYSQLKKCLKKVQRELCDLGLDPETLGTLLNRDSSSPIALQYRLKSTSSKVVVPKLTVLVHLHDGVAVDAKLSATSRSLLERIKLETSADEGALTKTNSRAVNDALYCAQDGTELNKIESLEQQHDDWCRETIEVPLVSDGEFFSLLQKDVKNLEDLQLEEQEKLKNDVTILGREVSLVSKPGRFSKNDLACWRQIFELYLDAQIFFSTLEQEHGARSSKNALKQLQWFQSEVEKRRLPQCFKVRESQQAFKSFLKINMGLLQNLKFQELNSLAVFKILKKFDKRTSLGISREFPGVALSDKLLLDNIAKGVCATMSQQLVSVVPQLSDYLCPICFAVAYRPVRLDCQHVFCVRCVIKIQRRGERHCPLCRADVVMSASADNLDQQLEKFLKKYFPDEVKEKQRTNEIERGVEEFGANYKHQECVVM